LRTNPHNPPQERKEEIMTEHRVNTDSLIEVIEHENIELQIKLNSANARIIELEEKTCKQSFKIDYLGEQLQQAHTVLERIFNWSMHDMPANELVIKLREMAREALKTIEG
jgi:uncharacterized coiled-coil protein SlyX